MRQEGKGVRGRGGQHGNPEAPVRKAGKVWEAENNEAL